MTVPDVVDQLEILIGLDGAPRRLVDALAETLVTAFAMTEIGAVERAEQIVPVATKVLIERAAKSDKAGTVCALVVLGSSADVVAGSCHVLPTDDAYVAAAKRQRVHVNPMLAAIRALTFDEFEVFGARVLAQLGATDTIVTRRSGDQGIDFYGQISVGALQNKPNGFFKLAHETKLYIAGQAKHYPKTNIPPATVRELIGAISLARTKTYSDQTIDLFEGRTLKPFSPLLPVLFTTGNFTSGAIDLANEAGIVVKSGRQLAAFLADVGVGMKNIEGGPNFDEALFRAWLNS